MNNVVNTNVNTINNYSTNTKNNNNNNNKQGDIGWLMTRLDKDKAKKTRIRKGKDLIDSMMLDNIYNMVYNMVYNIV